ncbi:hypothetical protein QQF64_028667 [Cirrhinus molitorella]|uniref:Uncharacterized protein n=1 Tax=Cirrhinus molitorella TaxID=172907 RepID=A0ABR3N7C0_9TELE
MQEVLKICKIAWNSSPQHVITGLTINTKKTVVMYQPAPGKPYQEPAVDKFAYLGSTLSQCVHIGAETDVRLAKASSAFGRLSSSVWDRKGISLTTKLKLYKAVVLPALLYASETWTIYKQHANKLNRFLLCCLRKLLKVKWQVKYMKGQVCLVFPKSQLRWWSQCENAK